MIDLSGTYRKTDRLILRNLESYDAYDVFDMFKVKEVSNPALLKVHSSVEMTEYILDQVIEYGDTLAIELEEERKLIGWIALMDFDSISIGLSNNYKGYEIGYSININYWNKGYASEAIRNIIDMAFNELDCSYLICEYLSNNKKSHRIAEKFNFEFLERTKIRDEYKKTHKAIRTILVNDNDKESSEYIRGKVL